MINVLKRRRRGWGVLLTFEGVSTSTLRLNKEPMIVFIVVGRGGLMLLASSLATTNSRQGAGILGQRARMWPLI